MKRKIISLITAGIMSCVSVLPVFGEETYKQNEQSEVQSLEVNDISKISNERMILGNLNLGTTVQGEIKLPTSKDSYKLILDKPGTLKLSYKTYISSSKIEIYDINGNRLFRTLVHTLDEYTPKSADIYVDLESGEYIVKIDTCMPGGYYHEGKYTIKATHTLANTNDIEPNNGTEASQLLQLNKMTTGFLSENDKSDYYKITKVKQGKLDFEYKSYIEDSRVTIIDSKGNQVDWFRVNGASKETPLYKNFQLNLNSGIYFIKISSDSTGKYALQVLDPSIKPVSPLTVNYINTTSTTIKGKTMPGAKVKAYVNNKQIGTVSTANSSGTFIIKNIPKQKQWTQVVVRANKSGYLQSSKTIPVRKLFDVFTVNRVYTTSNKIRGKSIRGSEVRAYVNGKQIGNKAVVASNGGYNITIPKQKKGTKIVVKIVKSGYVPTQKTVKVE